MTLRVTKRQLQACGIFRKLGMHPEGAAALVGNFVQESGVDLDSTMYRAHPDASGGIREDLKSGGIAEWLGDRKLAYIKFAEEKLAHLGLREGSTLLDDLETQCEFVVHELKHGENGNNPEQYAELWRQLTTETLIDGAPRSIATLTANFMLLYERPKLGVGTDKLGEVRIPYAEAVAERYALIEAADKQADKPEPQGEPSIPLPQIPGPKIPPAIPPMPTIPAEPPARPPISASTAAFQTAMRDTFEVEIESRLAEIAVFREILASLDTLSTATPLLALPAPAGSPATTIPTPTPTPQRKSNMNEQALSAVRSTLLALGGAAVSMGVVDNATMTTIIGAVMVVVPGAWSLWRHRQAGTIAAAAALPAVQQIVTTPAIANSPEFAANPTVVAKSAHRLMI